MRVVHYRDAYQNDIPRIIQPERALGYIRRSLSSQPGFNQTVFGLDNLLRECGISYAPSQYQIDSTLSRIAWRLESGDFFLLGDRDDDFGSIQFFGDISPFVSSTFRERVKRLPPRPQFGHGNYAKASEPIVEPNITPAPEAPAELKETGITKAINAMMGGAKQVINDYIDNQRAAQAEWFADQGIIKAKDEASGKVLTPEELGERYRGNPTLPLADNEQAGAEAVLSMAGYDAALLVAEAAVNRKKIVTNAKEIKDTLIDAVKNTQKSPALDFNKINMRSADDLMGVEPASPELISAISKKRDVVIAKPGSEELRMLDYFGAEASVSGVNNTHILFRENPSKAAMIEEFLHGTQSRLGITDRLGTSGLGSAETHVKDFMINHQKMLGLGDEDIQILKILRDKGL
ncbi:hypothetical protein [Shewanella algae]|uniref:hypothetical protein n=2 Tax=Shewanella algae TaxID=38313 RepID=UPI002358D0B6|nr:hypothetical protein [Shewanella algae]MDC8853129.1 hypothetical protein [Shewanella algae]